MRGNSRGFTLIEVLIVVVILAVLAAVIIPHFTDCSDDAKKSTLTHNLSILRAQDQFRWWSSLDDERQGGFQR